MLERELQDYLFSHPEVLFPGEAIQERSREFYIQGKRIDLLFRVGGTRYIVELKAVPMSREHIGQVVEYYGLMRDSIKDGTFKMVLVAPSIPQFRRIFLEEIGIRCVEIPAVPSGETDVEHIARQACVSRKSEQAKAEVSAWLPQVASVRYSDIVTSVTKESLAISHLILRDSLEPIREAFSEYEILPIRMARSESPDVICGSTPVSLNSVPQWVHGGAWWAYAFGESEQMPKNDVPNISAMAMPWSLDLAINAELRTSQAVMRAQIAAEQLTFDRLVRDHGRLQFQALLKLEHQPRFYHWIPLATQEPGTWNGASVVEFCRCIEGEYDHLRESWIARIEKFRSELSAAQAAHMRKRNISPNLALRLIRPFPKEDGFWQLPYREQLDTFVSECRRLKPLIGFLR